MNFLSAILVGMLLSLLPVIELRGGIPITISQGVNPILALLFCSIANIIIIPLIFLFLDHAHKYFLNFRTYRNTFNVFLKKIRIKKERVEKNYQTYGMIALTLFVAIPLPITGAWTGTFIAWLLNLNKKKSFLAISLGVIIAGVIVTLIATGIWAALKFLI